MSPSISCSSCPWGRGWRSSGGPGGGSSRSAPCCRSGSRRCSSRPTRGGTLRSAISSPTPRAARWGRRLAGGWISYSHRGRSWRGGSRWPRPPHGSASWSSPRCPMRPWAPAGWLRNYCTASYPTSEIFSGTARTMTLNGVALFCDQDLPRGGIRRQIRRGEIALETVAVAGDPSLGRRVIHLVRTPGTTLLVLAQQGRATAVFTRRPWPRRSGSSARSCACRAPFLLDRAGPWSWPQGRTAAGCGYRPPTTGDAVRWNWC